MGVILDLAQFDQAQCLDPGNRLGSPLPNVYACDSLIHLHAPPKLCMKGSFSGLHRYCTFAHFLSILFCLIRMTTKFRSKRAPVDPSGHRDAHEDPLSQAMMPPKDETPEERALRLEAMQEATRVSREIDESLLESKRAYEKRKKAIKVLLLGGSFKQDVRSRSQLGTK